MTDEEIFTSAMYALVKLLKMKDGTHADSLCIMLDDDGAGIVGLVYGPVSIDFSDHLMSFDTPEQLFSYLHEEGAGDSHRASTAAKEGEQ